MKRLLPAIAFVCLLSVPSMAGETNGPGKTYPPPCTENCSSSTAIVDDGLIIEVILRMILIIQG